MYMPLSTLCACANGILLSRFCRWRQAALLAETSLLASLVDFCALSPLGVAVDVAAAVVNLCDTDSAPLQQKVRPGRHAAGMASFPINASG